MPLAYDRLGTGPPLVLLHGVGHRRQAWDPVRDLLTPHRDVVTVDLPGHGASPPLRLAGRSPVQAMLDEVLGLLDELGWDRPHLAGNSLGGALALLTAARGRAATVTALSPAGFWSSERQFRVTRTLFRVMQAVGARIGPAAATLSRSTAGRALLYAPVVARPSRLTPERAAADAAAFLTARPAMNAVLAAPVSFTARIPDGVPVTIAWGTRDRLLRPRQARVARRRLPQARVVPLPGCGHVPMSDDPLLVARILLDGSDPASAARTGRAGSPRR